MAGNRAPRCAMDRRAVGGRTLEGELGAAARNSRLARPDAERVHTLEDRTRVRNRIEQLCQSNNIKVSWVATDLFGLSGRESMRQVLGGKANPIMPAGWPMTRALLCATRNARWQALDGTFTAEQRWLLGRELAQTEWLERQREALEAEIERRTAVSPRSSDVWLRSLAWTALRRGRSLPRWELTCSPSQTPAT